MGRQTRFHMLPDDCQRFIAALKEIGAVRVANWGSSETQDLVEVDKPSSHPNKYCIWNDKLLPKLVRDKYGPHYSVAFEKPVIQFSYTPELIPWDNRIALVQGRIWTGPAGSNREFDLWYKAIVRWLLKNSLRIPALGLERDSICPAAYDWFLTGGVLLPGFSPPETQAWKNWVEAQDKARESLIHAAAIRSGFNGT